MLRFQPDSWIEGLLRPLIMMEPKAGVYFEAEAADMRFALFIAFLAIAALARRVRNQLGFEQRQLIFAMVVVLYVWTFVIGNGRYFMAGLVLIGPLLVVGWRLLPGTAPFRWLALIGAAVLQCAVIAQTYEPNTWGFGRWRHGPAVDLPDSPLRQEPAVFITSSAISYSILVPKFHPQSRWTNLVGQRDLTPSMREYQPLVELLSSPLPKYAVMQFVAGLRAGPDQQPAPDIRNSYKELLAPYGLSLNKVATCAVLRSKIVVGPPESDAMPSRVRGFWICPLLYSDADRRAHVVASAAPILSARVAEAFHMIEQRCPRFFPPGDSNDRKSDELQARNYGSDTRLMVDVHDDVYLKYYRAINPIYIGVVDKVRRGDFEIPCDKLPGRYQMPWLAD